LVEQVDSEPKELQLVLSQPKKMKKSWMMWNPDS
jgi:hypothetical protein